MIVRFENCELKLEEILKEVDTIKLFNENELIVVRLIRQWLNGESSFTFQTSGSTGRPKSITIPREKIAFSAKSTLNYIDPDNQFKSTLLCINPNFIGGAMVVFRALIHDMDLTVINPAGDLSKQIQDSFYDLVSLVPIQIRKLSEKALRSFHTIIVGGGQLPEIQKVKGVNIYSSFGMTETVSHFALKNINEPHFKVLNGTEVTVSDNGNLKIKSFLTDHKWLTTNDLIKLISSDQFKWIGRSDFIINSGGIKVNPETVEKQLESQYPNINFMISSVPDPILENKIILVIEGKPFDFTPDFSMLEKYHRPKEVVYLNSFVRTASEKIDRIKTRESLLTMKI